MNIERFEWIDEISRKCHLDFFFTPRKYIKL